MARRWLLPGGKDLLRNVSSTDGLRFRLVDADKQVVGRLATEVARMLMGKDKPTYAPDREQGDVVVVINARNVVFTGNKLDDKVYKRHTGYPGGIRERTVRETLARSPEDVLRLAVTRMLPRNKLHHFRERKLQIFPDAQHPFVGHPALVPFTMPPRRLRDKPGEWGVQLGDLDWEALWRVAAGDDYQHLVKIPQYDPAVHGPFREDIVRPAPPAGGVGAAPKK